MQELKSDDIIAQTERSKTSMQGLQQQLTSLLKTQDQVLSSAGKMSSAYGDALKNLQQQISALVKTEEKLITANEKAKSSYKEATKEAKKYEDAIEEVNKEVKKGTERVAASTSAFEKNKEAITSLKNDYKDLSKTLDEHHIEKGKLIKQTGDLTGKMEGQIEVLAEIKDVFEFQEKIFEGVDNSLESIKKQAGGYEDVVDSLKSGFTGLSTGIDLIKTGFQSIGGAVKATGFGLLMLVIESLTEYFTTDKIGIKQLRGGLAAIGVVTGKVKTLFRELAGIIVNALSKPAETVKKIWNAVVENFSNRFKALGVILDGVMHLDTKKVADGVVQLSTGVTNGTDKVVKGFQRVKEELVKTGKEMVVAYEKAYAESGKKVKGPVRHRKAIKVHRDTENSFRKISSPCRTSKVSKRTIRCRISSFE